MRLLPKSESQKVSDETVMELFQLAERDKVDMARLCLHKDEASELMAMVIVPKQIYLPNS